MDINTAKNYKRTGGGGRRSDIWKEIEEKTTEERPRMSHVGCNRSSREAEGSKQQGSGI